MLPVIIVVLGLGAVAAHYFWSEHQKATDEAAQAHDAVDEHAAAALDAHQESAAQQDPSMAAAARQRGDVHTNVVHVVNVVAAKKVTEAAATAKTDRARMITALQAALTEANFSKANALRMMSRAADLGQTNPAMMRGLMDAAQSVYDAAQARAFAAQTQLRRLGVNPRDIPPPQRTDASR